MIKFSKVEQINPDGTRTDITDKPELWFPEIPEEKNTPGIQEALKERLSEIVGKDLTLRQVEKIVELFGKDDRIDKAILFCDDLLNNEGYYYSDEWDAALNKMKEYLQSLNQ